MQSQFEGFFVGKFLSAVLDSMGEDSQKSVTTDNLLNAIYATKYFKIDSKATLGPFLDQNSGERLCNQGTDTMDVAVMTDIMKTVLRADMDAEDGRADGTSYTSMRRIFLSIRARSGKLLPEGAADRRGEYIKIREAVLRRRFAYDGSECPAASGTGSRRSSLDSARCDGQSLASSSSHAPSPASAFASQQRAPILGRRRSVHAGQQPIAIAPRRAGGSDTRSVSSLETGSARGVAGVARAQSPLVPRRPSSAALVVSAAQACGSPAGSAVAAPMSPTSPRAGCRTLGEIYAFAGMHHIFAEHKQAVTTVKFANDNKDLLAFASEDGSVSVCTVVSHPYRITCLRGHYGPVTDIDWGVTNELIVTASVDKSAKIWQARSGLHTRHFQEQEPVMACLFHPLNNNFVVLGTKMTNNDKGLVKVLNVSTGRCISSQKTAAMVRSLAFDNAGNFLFCGDEKGIITCMKLYADGQLQVLSRTRSSGAVLSLEFKGLYLRGKYDPVILAGCRDSSARLYSVVQNPPGALSLRKTFPLSCKKNRVRCHFCPLVSSQGVCVVAGGEDTVINFYDASKQDVKPINRLQGHSSTVFDVAWSYDETLFASCDADGQVYVWKRVLNPANA
eukprot:m51a1_g6294 hypothetical protein (618) ;mRNA; r:268575-276526